LKIAAVKSFIAHGLDAEKEKIASIVANVRGPE
jgi:hypothetical protein